LSTTLENIEVLFQSRQLFEKNVLNAVTNKDRAEIVHLLAVRMVNDLLKEHLNFVYLKDLSDFTLQHVLNILFKEIASEWVDYAIEDLGFTKTDAIAVLKDPKKVKFIRNLTKEYYRDFKKFIFEEISESFVQLLLLNSVQDTRSRMINTIINSDLIPNRSILNINSSDQLCESVLIANKKKTEAIEEIKLTIQDMEVGIRNQALKIDKRESLAEALPIYKRRLKELENVKLATYSNTLQRAKRAIVNALESREEEDS